MARERIPTKGERVWADGLNGEFTVLKVDVQRSVADLMLMTGTHKIEKGIPFGAIQSAGGNVN